MYHQQETANNQRTAKDSTNIVYKPATTTQIYNSNYCRQTRV